MTHIRIPYHTSALEADLPTAWRATALTPPCHAAADVRPPSIDEQRRCVERALDRPIGSPPLETLAAGKATATVITSDHTRPVPSRITLPLLLDRLRRGNPAINIRILVATGCHRATTPGELREKFGEEVVRRETFLIHDCTDTASLRQLARLPSGGELWLNRAALDTDLLVAEGFIEPHFFAGFSGGRKSVLPGIAGRTTVLANHCAAFIADPHARAGSLAGNPIHRDMLFAAQQAHLAFILNVTINTDKSIRAAFAGHPEEAHATGCRHLAEEVTIPRMPGDIVITGNGGYPLDQNIYQAVKGMTAAEACCNPGGTVIMVAGCCDGAGGENFYQALSEMKNPRELLDAIGRVPQDKTAPDQWEVQILARILAKHRVILVSDVCDATVIRSMGMEAATSLPEAIDIAGRTAPQDARVTVIPDGVSVIVENT
ncbi:MAG TPA: nickel-dependent lactate racemase [Kiritimatiellia bacterium]|nr:nickel-dependent lactate racemase [Kiritimatiellia bacterium]HRU70451.1 nickel-dependent lactate racemase [Kiritimatiellia bacterium]